VYLSGPIDLFLGHYLFSALTEECALQRIHRFFFIRYLDPGLHLRFRFTPGREGSPAMVREWMEKLVSKFADSLPEAGPCKMEESVYDREEHYFGETMYSVYSELLNEQTSWLGLRLLGGYCEERPQLMALLVTCILFFFNRMTGDQDELISALGLSGSFAGKVLTEHGLTPHEQGKEEQAAFNALIPKVFTRTGPFLCTDPAATAIIRLARRARKAGEPGKFVVTHAFHLFCNKLGFSLQDEYRLFSLLQNHIGEA